MRNLFGYESSDHSSSMHVINADRELDTIKKIQYFILNFICNLKCKVRIVNFSTKKFSPTEDQIDSHLKSLSEPQSPSRILSNIFWESIDWSFVNETLQGEIRAIEVGCGSGRYGRKISQLTQIQSYMGVDIANSPDWNSNSESNFDYVLGSYEEFDSIVDKQNLVITQSALEHFENDLKFFGLIGDYARSVTFPVLSIHLLPSPAGLFKFLLHGIRQYNKRSISNLLASAGPTNYAVLYSLGGIRSNFFHFVSITLRSLILRKWIVSQEIESYKVKVQRPLVIDSKRNSFRCPSFYALVIYWGEEPMDRDIV